MVTRGWQVTALPERRVLRSRPLDASAAGAQRAQPDSSLPEQTGRAETGCTRLPHVAHQLEREVEAPSTFISTTFISSYVSNADVYCAWPRGWLQRHSLAPTDGSPLQPLQPTPRYGWQLSSCLPHRRG